MQSKSGRRGGNSTSRPLPEDPEVDLLSDAQRSELVAVWLGRAATERRVADAFQVVHAALVKLRSSPDLIALAARAVDDEHRHAELARQVASSFARRELEPPARLTLLVPEHRGASPKLLHTLHVFGQCALNETFASAFLEVSLNLARGKLARAALRELLSDEIDHARIGWAHLAELSTADREELAPWLHRLAVSNLRTWRSTPRRYSTDPVLHRHGAPPADAVEAALLGALRDLVIPSFARFDLPTGSLRVWLAQGAPTD